MNAHREFVKPQNGFLQIPVPEEMKQTEMFEIFIVPAYTKNKTASKKAKLNVGTRLKQLRDKITALPETQKITMFQNLDQIRGEWERDF